HPIRHSPAGGKGGWRRSRTNFDVDLCSLVMSLRQFRPCRYRGPAAGRLAAVAHARLAARRYYATCWVGEYSLTRRSQRHLSLSLSKTAQFIQKIAIDSCAVKPRLVVAAAF